MSRVNQTSRHTRVDPNALLMPPRLTQLPEERWFDDDNERLAYDKRLSKMEILPPKFIGDGVFPDEKYPEFWRLIDIQGLRPFLYMPAYTTMFIRDNLNDDGIGSFVFGFRLGGRNYEFPLTTLANVWGLKNKGVTFKGGNNPHGTWNEINKLDAIRGLRLEHAAPGKCAISRISTDHRLLLYVLSYMLLPRKSNHGSASEEDLLILWAMVQEKKIHWPYLMAYRMIRYSQGKPTSFLAHAHLWSRIFEIAPLDLTREEDVEPEISHAISSKKIHQMRRKLVDHISVAENAGVDAMADAQPQVETDALAQVPTETGVPPQFQPEIAEFVRKGFEDMRSMMTEGFARLSNRIDRLDTHMISQDTDLRNLQDEFRSFHSERMYVDFQEQPEDIPMQD
ncbi:hypothetical protein PIB30_079106 [Stylosanthes scabra]|uniref:Aminotransferase-like plant mobile domain-containing protein n=1 Tax=Stylosanthes scabra TaxID=79078 RepID=A0ABU6VPS2_9FABA|nr:hypothetical protein [Stylosanthes scabra]